MKPYLCIYHGNCADGFGAAYAVWKHLGAALCDFFPGVYQQEPPDVTGRHVIFVDFSYKKAVIEDLARKAKSITILDHHQSAADDLAAFKARPGEMEWHFDDFAAIAEHQGIYPVRALFDMERSGAMIAWEYFHPHEPAPALIRHIQDRDLWQFRLNGTREIQANLFSYPYSFEVWDGLMQKDPMMLRLDGAAIERKHFKDIDELLAVTRRRMTIGGYDVPVANLPYTMSSDAGHKLAHGEPFAACYWDTPAGRVFSLRAPDDGMDVQKIAVQYGGGGHPRAAGFSVAWGDPRMPQVCTPVRP